MPNHIVSGFFVLGGVIIGLLSSHLMEWLKERRLRERVERERKLNLKRELYLPLMGAFTEGANLMARIPVADPKDLAGLRLSPESERALAAKDLIANAPVLRTTSHAARTLVGAIMKILVLKTAESKITVDIEALGRRVELLGSEASQLRELGLNPTEVVQRAGEIQEELRELGAHREALFAQKVDLLKQMTAMQLEEVAAINEASLEAVIEIRMDLGIETAPAEIRSVIGPNRDKVGPLAEQFTNDVLRIFGFNQPPKD